uniref:Ring finger protein 222 n=1 Tax=Erpetoichthys calabaricus TaxID=27687 RepID=A0A8C4TDL6_ERPCA
MTNNGSAGDPPPEECPVCYESYKSTSKRTLSCGHEFCHDCLVKTLVSSSQDGAVTRKNIICPICRHLTYINKKKPLALPNVSSVKQTLEVPVSPTPLGSSQSSGFTWDSQDQLQGVNAVRPSRSTRLLRFFRRSPGLPRTPSTHPQIFTISSQGRPMTEEDSVSIVLAPLHRTHRISCCRLKVLFVCLLLIIVGATISTILPWVLIK